MGVNLSNYMSGNMLRETSESTKKIISFLLDEYMLGKEGVNHPIVIAVKLDKGVCIVESLMGTREFVRIRNSLDAVKSVVRRYCSIFFSSGQIKNDIDVKAFYQDEDTKVYYMVIEEPFVNLIIRNLSNGTQFDIELGSNIDIGVFYTKDGLSIPSFVNFRNGENISIEMMLDRKIGEDDEGTIYEKCFNVVSEFTVDDDFVQKLNRTILDLLSKMVFKYRGIRVTSASMSLINRFSLSVAQNVAANISGNKEIFKEDIKRRENVIKDFKLVSDEYEMSFSINALDEGLWIYVSNNENGVLTHYLYDISTYKFSGS